MRLPCADIQGNVTFYGGLVRRVGSDDEIAGVMGHEMTHVLLKHNEKAQQNTAVGMVIGGLITGAIVATAGPRYTAQCTSARTDLLESGMQAGAVAGRIRYSPEMELEADQLATYIVREAGYDLRAARKLFIRIARGAAGCGAGTEGARRVPEDTPDGREAERALECYGPTH